VPRVSSPFFFYSITILDVMSPLPMKLAVLLEKLKAEIRL